MKKMMGIGFVFLVATIAWLVLGGVTHQRKEAQEGKLRGSVQALWGNEQTQRAPSLTFHHQTSEPAMRTETKDGVAVTIHELKTVSHARPVTLARSDIGVWLHSDLRRKGLAWYSLYDVLLKAEYAYVHAGPEHGELEVGLAFPDASAPYDDFRFEIDGREVGSELDPDSGQLRARVAVAPGQRVAIRFAYRSRGLDRWTYAPSDGVTRLENFRLTMHTDFDSIDFPTGTLSPSARTRTEQGHVLSWAFRQIVTGKDIGMVMPSRIQPGALAAELSLSAPISLFFYFFVIFVLATLRKIDLHPINYLLIAGAFFGFHLLFAYSVDHLPVEAAFVLSSATSIFLVVSYLRLVVSRRFAYVEAALAQLVYLVGFSLAHFWEGFTGLTTTVLAIVTLFLLMQLTGRVRWSEALASKPADPARAAA